MAMSKTAKAIFIANSSGLRTLPLPRLALFILLLLLRASQIAQDPSTMNHERRTTNATESCQSPVAVGNSANSSFQTEDIHAPLATRCSFQGVKLNQRLREARAEDWAFSF
jgi:hypothetical protein